MYSEERLLVTGVILGSCLTIPWEFMKIQKQVDNAGRGYSIMKYFTAAGPQTARTGLTLLINYAMERNVGLERPFTMIFGSSALLSLFTPIDYFVVKKQTGQWDTSGNLWKKANGSFFIGYFSTFFKYSTLLTTAYYMGTPIYPYYNLFWAFSIVMITQIPLTAVSYPFDTITTHLQHTGKYKGIADCYAEIYKTRGFFGFYQGVEYYYLRKTANNVILISLLAYFRAI